MSNEAFEARLKGILAELKVMIGESGLTKAGEIREMLKRDLKMDQVDAEVLTMLVTQAISEDPLGDIYSGAKAALRPIHEKLMAAISEFGPFETAPKKTYISLRRKKQFATIGPATNSRVEVGMNMKGVKVTERLVAVPPGGICQYKVKLEDVKEVDKELIAWIRQAYEAAG
jgi:predicted transport protein